MERPVQKDIYYTHDHEWIDFHGTVALVGVCGFKLTGFKEIEELVFTEPFEFKKQGDVIGRVQYRDYVIEIHMPVDGKIMKLNEKLQRGNESLLLSDPEGHGWIASIVPSQPYERTNLLLPKHYRPNGKDKYAK